MNTMSFQQRVQMLKKRDQLLYQLDLKYIHFINNLLQQKQLISAQITNQYDQLINNLDNSLYNNLSAYINNCLDSLIDNQNYRIYSSNNWTQQQQNSDQLKDDKYNKVNAVIDTQAKPHKIHNIDIIKEKKYKLKKYVALDSTQNAYKYQYCNISCKSKIVLKSHITRTHAINISQKKRMILSPINTTGITLRRFV